MRHLFRMKLILIFSVLFLSLSTFASPTQMFIPLDKMKFEYRDDEGTFSYPCKPELSSADNPYDYRVSCYDGTKLVKTLNVHLAVSVYRFTSAPKTKIEILYWVNLQGATSWLIFNEDIAMAEFQSSQSIAGEPTSLRMVLTLK